MSNIKKNICHCLFCACCGKICHSLCLWSC